MVLVALVFAASMPVEAQRRRSTRRAPRIRTATRTVTPAPLRYTVPAETTLRVRMNEKISSGSARVGDRFTTTVVDPVYANGIEVIPAGSIVQ